MMEIWYHGASLVAQTVKRLPTIRETRVRSLGRKDPLEKEMATHFSILARKVSWTEDPGRLQSMGSQRVGHDWATSLHFTSCYHGVTVHLFPTLYLVSTQRQIRTWVTCFFVYLFFFWPHSTWNLSSLTRHQTWVPWIESQSLSYWITKGVPCLSKFKKVMRHWW